MSIALVATRKSSTLLLFGMGHVASFHPKRKAAVLVVTVTTRGTRLVVACAVLATIHAYPWLPGVPQQAAR